AQSTNAPSTNSSPTSCTTCPVRGHPDPTHCATPQPPTCSTAEPTCAQCKTCSGTPASAQPSSTHTYRPSDFATATASPTPAPDQSSGLVGNSTERGIPPRNSSGDTYSPNRRTPKCRH